MISICFYCWWVEDISYQSPVVGPCIHTHAELQKGLILKPEPSPSPKPQARHLFLKPYLGLKAKFTEGVKICATAEQQKTLCAGVVAGTRFMTPKIATTLTKTLA